MRFVFVCVLLLCMGGPLTSSFAQGPGGGGGPAVEHCYEDATVTCAKALLVTLIEEENKPIKHACGICLDSVCLDEGQRGAFPAGNIDWVTKHPKFPGGGSIGKDSFKEGETEVECGRTKKCTGCVPKLGIMYCDAEDKDAWKIKPRRKDGNDCPYSLQE